LWRIEIAIGGRLERSTSFAIFNSKQPKPENNRPNASLDPLGEFVCPGILLYSRAGLTVVASRRLRLV
jgi:hypothetical protein